MLPGSFGASFLGNMIAGKYDLYTLQVAFRES